MLNEMRRRFVAWSQLTAPLNGLYRFRIAFAALWLCYDVLDLSYSGTSGYLWLLFVPWVHHAIKALQGILIISELALIVGYRTRVFCVIAFVARAIESFLFPLNDFLAYTVIMAILAQCDTETRPPKAVPVWPRDVLVLQMSWIYFATALLKLNPSFLSGGDLYVRQNYTAEALHWFFIPGYRALITQLSFNGYLAWMAVTAEFLMSILLKLWWRFPQWRRPLHFLATGLAIGIHGFAAATVNVFFFGISMILQVALLTSDEPSRPE